MSKIVQAVNAMISNRQMIRDVLINSSSKEIYFKYKQYIWSIWREDDTNEYVLWHYPKARDVHQIANNDDWQNVPLVSYRTEDIGTKEAHASFVELYQVVKDAAYGMEDVLNDIISDADPI